MSRLGSKCYRAIKKKAKASSKQVKAIKRAPRGAVFKTAKKHGVSKRSAKRYRKDARDGKLSPPERSVQRDYALRECIRHLQQQSAALHGKRVKIEQIIKRYVDSYMNAKNKLKGTKVPSRSYVEKFVSALKKENEIASLQRAPKKKPKNSESDLTQLSSVYQVIQSNYTN